MRFINKLRKSTFARLIATFILIIIPLYILGFAIYSWAVETVRNDTSKTLLAQADFYLDSFDKQIAGTKALLFDCIGDADLRQLASIPESLDEYDKIQAISRLRNRLLAIANSSKYIKDVRAYIPAIDRVVKTSVGGYASALRSDEYEAVNGATAGDDPILYWNGGFYLGVRYPNASVQNAQALAGKKPLFILLVELSVDEMRKDLQKFSGSQREGAMLVDARHGALLAGVGAVGTGDRVRQFLNGSAQDGSGSETFPLDGKNYLVMYSRSRPLNVMLSSYLPESDVFSQLNRYVAWFWIFTALALTLVVLYSFITYRQVHKPLLKLTRSFKQLEKGDMNIAIEHASDDEFRYLYAGYNEMVSKLNVLIDQAYRQKILAQHAQLKQLQSQINPHFLYNSFFTLNNMIVNYDTDAAEQLTKQLGNYFRFITRSAADEVALMREVSHARTYTDIQVRRFKNRIRLEFPELPGKYANVIVPRLILQPIVENVFEHGLKNKVSDGLVRIRFDEEPGRLLLSVEDNGDETGDAEIDELNRKLSAEDDQIESTGIINIHHRIAARYGEGFGVTVCRSELGGLRVNIAIKTTEETNVQADDRG